MGQAESFLLGKVEVPFLLADLRDFIYVLICRSTEKDKIISELKEDLKSTKDELENLASVMKQEKEEKDGIIKGFEDNVKLLEENAKKQEEEIEEKKAEAKKMEGIIESAKTKNNVSTVI